MGRRYRRQNTASSIIFNTVYIGSKLPWWGALTFGFVTFLLFYFVAPEWLASKLAEQETSRLYPLLEATFGRRVHWFEWIGIACGLIGVFFGIRNYLLLNQASNKERGIVALLSKIFGRGLD